MAAVSTSIDVRPFLSPIREDDPAGDNLRWEEEYGSLEASREEGEDAASAGIWQRDRKRADWDLVITLGSQLLKERTKDLQVAAWVAEGMAKRRGLAGIRDGLVLVRAIQEAFWKSAHPESGDLELREGVYDFLDDEKRFPLMIRTAPLTDVLGTSRHSFLTHKDSREAEGKITKNPELEATLRAEGKIRADEFDKAASATSPEYMETTIARLEECEAAVNQLNESLRQEDHYGKNAPTLTKTRTALEEVLKLARQYYAKHKPVDAETPAEETPEPVEETEPSPGQEASVVAAEPATPPQEPPSRPAPKPVRRNAGGPIADASDARNRVVDAASFLRQADPADPSSYVLIRALRMGELYQSNGPLDPGSLGRPDGDTRESLRRLASEGDWTNLLDCAEQALAQPEGRGWLDARRASIRAMEELGRPSAAKAAKAILGAELRDHPEWPDMDLRDGTPSANRETRAWLKATFEPPPAREPAYVPQSAPALPPPRERNGSEVEKPRDPWELAQESANSGQPQQAIALIASAARNARTGRERFLRTFQQAELCLILSRPAVATPLLEGLARQVDELHLDQWEDPSLCARVLSAFYRCLRKQQDPRAESVYKRLCQLDIAQALSLADEAEA